MIDVAKINADVFLSIIQSFTLLVIYYYFSIKLVKKSYINLYSFNLFFLYHNIITIFFIVYTITNVADSYTVYFISQINEFNSEDQISMLNKNWEIGRGASILLVHFIYSVFRFTYPTMIILYGLISFSGMAVLYGLVHKFIYKYKIDNFKYLLLFFYFPSLHFWSVSLSKDAIIIFSICLFLFSILNIRKYYFYLLISMICMSIFRPYIGVFFIFGLFLNHIFFSNIFTKFNLLRIIFLFSLTFLFVIFLFISMKYIGLEPKLILQPSVLISNVNEILDQGKSVAQTQAGYIEKSPYNLIPNYFIYLFYPINIFHQNSLYILSSFENIFLILFFILLGYYKNFKKLINLDYIFLILFILILTILSVRTMNYGISVRQKWMILPILYIFFINKKKIKND